MVQQFWHDLIIEKSFAFLQEFSKRYQFVLIGGWAIYFYTHALKSKDIDIIIDFTELGRLKQEFIVIKNERLKKYEIKAQGFDVDIYVPNWSILGLPPNVVIEDTIIKEGFRIPRKEVLLVLKTFVYAERKASLKGKKDMLDIISLLYRTHPSMQKFSQLLQTYHLEYLQKELGEILQHTYEVKEFGLNRKSFSDFKKGVLAQLT